MIRLVQWGRGSYAYRCAPAHREAFLAFAGDALDVNAQRFHIRERRLLRVKPTSRDEDLRVPAGFGVEGYLSRSSVGVVEGFIIPPMAGPMLQHTL